jgi:hypothetical protein
MRPIARAGTLVRLRPVARGEDLRGAIVAVDAGDLVIVHRVEKVSATHVFTRGIASQHPDPPWQRDRVIGVVTAAGAFLTGQRLLRGAAAVASVTFRSRPAVRVAAGLLGHLCPRSVRRKGKRAW